MAAPRASGVAMKIQRAGQRALATGQSQTHQACRRLMRGSISGIGQRRLDLGAGDLREHEGRAVAHERVRILQATEDLERTARIPRRACRAR